MERWMKIRCRRDEERFEGVDQSYGERDENGHGSGFEHIAQKPHEYRADALAPSEDRCVDRRNILFESYGVRARMIAAVSIVVVALNSWGG